MFVLICIFFCGSVCVGLFLTFACVHVNARACLSFSTCLLCMSSRVSVGVCVPCEGLCSCFLVALYVCCSVSVCRCLWLARFFPLRFYCFSLLFSLERASVFVLILVLLTLCLCCLKNGCVLCASVAPFGRVYLTSVLMVSICAMLCKADRM